MNNIATITFKEFDDDKGSRQVIEANSVDDKPEGCEVTFHRGISDTRRPKRYTAILQSGAGSGTWTTADNTSGILEHVARKSAGPEHTITGIWIEDGKRLRFEVLFWK